MKATIIAVLAFLGYFTIAGATWEYMNKYDHECSRFEPTRSLGVFTPAAMFWPFYWPWHAGELLVGHELTCLGDQS